MMFQFNGTSTLGWVDIYHNFSTVYPKLIKDLSMLISKKTSCKILTT